MIANSPYSGLDNTTNNFLQTVPNPDYRAAVMRAFKDEYLLDYVKIEDPGMKISRGTCRETGGWLGPPSPCARV